jgi:NAD(P)-dependent dehydrogenase (short-subunit alcohol dehydrogenase family)
MVKLETVRAFNNALVNSDDFTVTNPFTVVVIGGTAGIGERHVLAIATAFADAGEKLRIFIVGRNQEAAERIIDDAKKLSPKGGFEFVKAGDLTLLRETAKVAEAIDQAVKSHAGTEVPKIDLLVMTQGYLTTKAWDGSSLDLLILGIC